MFTLSSVVISYGRGSDMLQLTKNVIWLDKSNLDIEGIADTLTVKEYDLLFKKSCELWMTGSLFEMWMLLARWFAYTEPLMTASLQGFIHEYQARDFDGCLVRCLYGALRWKPITCLELETESESFFPPKMMHLLKADFVVRLKEMARENRIFITASSSHQIYCESTRFGSQAHLESWVAPIPNHRQTVSEAMIRIIKKAKVETLHRRDTAWKQKMVMERTKDQRGLRQAPRKGVRRQHQ